MGFGDFHYSMDAVDNSIFDVKYCLTQGSIDSFVLVCLTGDFKTTVTAIDAEFGDVALRGWSVNFRNLAPGFTVIYGRGSRPIPTSGLSTLMRVYLSDNILQRNPAGEESKSSRRRILHVCVSCIYESRFFIPSRLKLHCQPQYSDQYQSKRF
jgi:hypothetical protein